MFIVVSGIAPAKSDLFICERGEPMVGDRHAMGVTAQIMEDMLWSSERTFRVDHPVLPEQFSEPRRESLCLSEERQLSMESELAVAKGALETCHKLAAKDATENLDGKKEGVTSLGPTRVIDGESSGRNDAMHMRMKPKLLIPGVQYAEEADFGPEMRRIASNFQKRFRTAAKQ